MRNMVDHNGRTIWFKGDPGPLAPKNQRVRGRKRKLLVGDDNYTKTAKSKLLNITGKLTGKHSSSPSKGRPPQGRRKKKP
jgi:hypothetical protein